MYIPRFLNGGEKIRVSTVDRFLSADRYSVCVTVILATDVLEPNTGPSSLFYLKLSLLLLSPIVSCIRWDVVTIVYYHIRSVYQTQ
jgi:hypothetical protein